MTEKSDDESVLGSLPATRPTRFGRERPKRDGGGTATAAKSTRPKAATKPKAAARPTAGKAKPAPGASGTARPATSKPRAAPEPHRPRPVRAGSPSLADSTERARTAEPPRESTTSPPRGTELVTTAIQAAGELAQIGLAVGGQVLRRAVDKLPRP